MPYRPPDAAPPPIDPASVDWGTGERPREEYFRCHSLRATVSVAQCRTNRLRLSAFDAVWLDYEPYPWEVRPRACNDCELARAMEAGRVPRFNAEQVLAGHPRQVSSGTGLN